MNFESGKRDPEKLYPDHYEFGVPEPISEPIQEREDFIPVTLTVIRHHLTPYKELQDPAFQFDPATPDLNSETLDLTDQGIEGMRAAAESLASRIDQKNEVIYVVSSPQYRAQSSLLVLQDELQKRGVEIVNDLSESTRHAVVPGLRQTDLIHPGDPEKGTEPWIKSDSAWRSKDPEVGKRTPPHLAHAEIAKAMGFELSELFTQSHTEIFQRFMRTLRHLSNIQTYLSEKTKNELHGKKLRIILLTHEELPSAFLQHAFGAKENLKNGQVLEINPHGPMNDGESVVLDSRLYPLLTTDTFEPPFSSEFPDVEESRMQVTFKGTPKSEQSSA